MLLLHSGGKVSEALRMALLVDKTQFGSAISGNVNEPLSDRDQQSARATSSLIQRDNDSRLLDAAPLLLPPLPEKKKLPCCIW